MTRVVAVLATLLMLAPVVALPAAAATTVASDGFSRTVSGGWGSASAGGAWTPGGANTTFNVRNDVGEMTMSSAGSSAWSTLKSTSARDVDQAVDIRVDKAPLGWGLLTSLIARSTTSGSYRIRARLAGDGVVRLSATRTSSTGAETAIGTETAVPGLTAAAGTRYRLRTQVTGASPTTLRARIWVAGTSEPTTWAFTTTDSTSGLQQAGATGVWTFLGGNQTNTPVTTSYDNLSVTDPAAPVASDTFTRTVSGGWGSASAGGAWTPGGANTAFNVRNGVGEMTMSTAGGSAWSMLKSVSTRDVDQVVDIRTDKAPLGWGLLTAVVSRSTTNGAYRVRARLAGDGIVRLSASRVTGSGAETNIGAEATVPGLTAAAGTRYRLRTQVTGVSPTTLRARIWVSGQTEPTTWPLTTTDSTSGLQQAGATGVWTFLSGNQTNTPVTLAFDDFTVTAVDNPTAPPPSPPGRPASLAATAGAVPLGSASYAIPTGAKFVSTAGSDTNAGTQAAPWRTLAKAVSASASGSTIVMRAGKYNDAAIFPYGKRLTIQNYPGEAVWLDSSQAVTGWVASGSVWRKDNWTFHPDHTDPTANASDPFFRMVSPEFPMAAYPDMVWFNGTQLKQVGALSEVTAGEFYVDETNHRLYIGNNPSGALVEAATKTEAIYINHGHGSVIRGIGVRRYATPVERYGTVKAFADNVTIENVHIIDSATRGLGIDGTGVTVNKVTVNGNGQLGIGAEQSDQLVIRQTSVNRNNLERFKNAPVAGGIKITSSRNTTYRGNAIRDHTGMGLWLDASCYVSVIQDNIIERNTGHGLFFELSSYGTVIDNLITNSGGTGMKILDAGHVRVWNNTFSRNRRNNFDAYEGVRVASDPNTPGHDPRYPNDPNVTWQVVDVSLRNNLFSNGQSDTTSLVGIDDAGKTKKASSMMSTNFNGYYRTASATPKWTNNWANYGGSPSMQVFTTVAAFRTATGQEAGGFGIDGGTTNPFFANETASDYSLRSGSQAINAGTALPADISTMIGVPASPVDMGKLTW